MFKNKNSKLKNDNLVWVIEISNLAFICFLLFVFWNLYATR